MKKILIISKAFAPLNVIGSIRPTKFAKYLKINSNYHITVLTTYKNHQIGDKEYTSQDMKYIDELIEVKSKSFKSWLKSLVQSSYENKVEPTISKKRPSSLKSSFNRLKKSISPIMKYIIFFYNLYESRSFYKSALKKIKRNNFFEYDVVISTYSPFASHQIARYIKDQNPKIKWIADFRDPVYRDFDTPFGFKKYCKNFSKSVCKKAEALTAVSQGVLDELYFDSCNAKHIITNGFDLDDISTIETSINPKFTLAYLGGLYNGKRDLSSLFRSIRELYDEGKIDIKNIQILYAGPSKNVFLSQINNYNLSDCTVAYDLVERRKSLQLQLESNILLLSSWNTKGNTGIITGKFLEYMMINKPIICTISGDLPNSKLKEMMKIAKNGLCYEQANEEVDFLLMKSYFLEQYNRYISGQELFFEPNQEYINKFNYKSIANQLEALF